MGLRRFDLRASLYLAAAVLCWSSVPIFLRGLRHDIDAWTANGLRYPISAVLYWPVLLVAHRSGRLDPKLFRRAIVPAAVAFAGQVLWALAPYYLEAATIGFLVQSSVVWGMVGALVLFADERPLLRSPAFYAGLVLAAGGAVALSIFQGALRASAPAAGVIIILGTGVFFGIYGPCVRACMRHDPPLQAFGVVAQYVSVATVLLMLGLGRTDVGGISPRAWGLVAVSSVLGIGLSHVLLYAAIRRIGAAIPPGVSLVTPFVTLVGARFALGETLGPAQIAAGAVMVVGGALLLAGQARLGPAVPLPSPPGRV